MLHTTHSPQGLEKRPRRMREHNNVENRQSDDSAQQYEQVDEGHVTATTPYRRATDGREDLNDCACI